MGSDLVVNSIVIFAAALVGGVWGATRRVSHDTLHLILSLAAGFFLGAVFLDLLPAALHEAGRSGSAQVGLWVLIGFLLIYLVEKVVAPRAVGKVSDGHSVVALTALVGLSAHSLAEGGALVAAGMTEHASGIYLSILLHKTIAALALGSLFCLSGFKVKRSITYVLFFSLMTPLGAFVTAGGLPGLEPAQEVVSNPALIAFSAGVFLYVAILDILPEVMHAKASIGLKILLVCVGAGVMWAVNLAHVH
jgi:zinc and cadmium transporter